MDEDRGTYSPPTEDHLSYEARKTPSRDQAPITLIISGILLVALLIAVVLFYNRGLNSHHGPAPVIGDAVGDFKDTKVQDAQPLNDDAGIATGDDSSAGPHFAASTEAPTLRDSTTDEAPPPVAPITGPLPSQVNHPAFNPPATSSAAPDTAPTIAQPAPSAQTPKTAPQPVKPLADASPAATAKPVVAKPAVALAKPAAGVADSKPAAAGTSSVQIGAFTSPELSDKAYNNVVSSYGLFLSGNTGKHVEKIVSNGSTFYRTSVTGFASADKAHAFCSALKAAGHDCFVK